MDYWLIAYIVISIIIGTGVSGFLYKRQQTTAAILSFILLVLIFVFYGLRWFDKGNLKGTQQGTVAWPPIVNTCPDFMVSYVSGNKLYCYDKNDTYKLKNSTTFSLASIYSDHTLGISDTKFFLNSDESTDAKKKIAKLSDDKGITVADQRWPLLKAFQSSSNLPTLSSSNAGGLRWEGIWDGRNATAEKSNPLPSLN